MKSKLIQIILLNLIIAMSLFSVYAQEGEEQERGEFFIEVEDWFAKLANIDYEIATIIPSESFITQGPNISVPFSYETSLKYKIGWTFKDNIGSVAFVYWGLSGEEQVLETDPGNFRFSQNLSFPLFAGAYDNGTADGASGTFDFRVRSLSFLFSREFAQMKRVNAEWRIGIRKISYKHHSLAEYYALLPTLIEPFATESLMPRSDIAYETSSSEARGIEAGATIQFPIVKGVSFGGDLGISFLRGRAEVHYKSANHYYTDDQGNYFNVQDRSLLTSDRQLLSTVVANGKDRESITQIIDADLKVNWNIWRGLDLAVGYSVSFWSGALLKEEILLTQSNPEDMLLRDYSQFAKVTRKDIAFEGAYLKLSYRY